MITPWRKWGAVWALLSIAIFFAIPGVLRAQDAQTARRVVSKVAPQYPEIARKMQIHGVVRLEVVIDSKGSAKSIQVKGGHPVLVEAAQSAVSKWRWEPAPHETTEVIDVKFDDQQ